MSLPLLQSITSVHVSAVSRNIGFILRLQPIPSASLATPSRQIAVLQTTEMSNAFRQAAHPEHSEHHAPNRDHASTFPLGILVRTSHAHPHASPCVLPRQPDFCTCTSICTPCCWSLHATCVSQAAHFAHSRRELDCMQPLARVLTSMRTGVARLTLMGTGLPSALPRSAVLSNHNSQAEELRFGVACKQQAAARKRQVATEQHLHYA